MVWGRGNRTLNGEYPTRSDHLYYDVVIFAHDYMLVPEQSQG